MTDYTNVLLISTGQQSLLPEQVNEPQMTFPTRLYDIGFALDPRLLPLVRSRKFMNLELLGPENQQIQSSRREAPAE